MPLRRRRTRRLHAPTTGSAPVATHQPKQQATAGPRGENSGKPTATRTTPAHREAPKPSKGAAREGPPSAGAQPAESGAASPGATGVETDTPDTTTGAAVAAAGKRARTQVAKAQQPNAQAPNLHGTPPVSGADANN
jgi:hypothetical protein